MKNCYALFIGVDHYQGDVPDLSGCVNDARQLQHYIEQELDTTQYTLHSKLLLSESSNNKNQLQATRANIIDGITEHLSQATGPEDLILFFYAGHGSTDKAHPVFKSTTGRVQTLLPTDMGIKDKKTGKPVQHILDKELRFLFNQLWLKTNAKIVVIQDSCHSTGATRNTGADPEFLEMASTTAALNLPTPEPIARFFNQKNTEHTTTHWSKGSLEELQELFSGFQFNPEAFQTAVQKMEDGQSFEQAFPVAPHIHMAACDEHEFAYEVNHPNGKRGGVFTYTLVQVLQQNKNTALYNDLFQRVRLSIAGVYKQQPDLYLHEQDPMATQSYFLGDLLKRPEGVKPPQTDAFQGIFAVSYNAKRGWCLSGSQMSLLPSLSAKRPTIPCEIFPAGQKPSKRPNAQIIKTESSFAVVQPSDAIATTLSTEQSYSCLIPAQYLRRRKINVAIPTQETNSSLFNEWFDKHPLTQEQGMWIGGGGTKIQRIPDAENADYLVRKNQLWLELYDCSTKPATLLCKASAFIKDGRTLALSTSDEQSYTSIDGEAILLQQQLFNPECPEAIAPLAQVLIDVFNSSLPANATPYTQARRKGPVTVAFETNTEGQAHPFELFRQKYAQNLRYYDAFFNWTALDKADYAIVAEADGFTICPVKQQKIEAVPVTLKIKGQHQKACIKVIQILQKICKYHTVQAFSNPAQQHYMKDHKLELQLDFASSPIPWDTNFNTIKSSFHNPAYFSDLQKGWHTDLSQLMEQPLEFHYDATGAKLNFNMRFTHLEGPETLYVAPILLDANFGIAPFDNRFGCFQLPSAAVYPDQGTAEYEFVTLVQPQQLTDFEVLESCTMYLKLFIAYERFDISSLLQAALPAPNASEEEELATKNRGLLQQRTRASQPASWAAYTIPIQIKKAIIPNLEAPLADSNSFDFGGFDDLEM